MGANDNVDDGTNSLVLNLETLTAEYDAILIRYNQAQVNYIDFLKGASQSGFTSIKGQTFLGTAAISTIAASTLDLCKASCSTTTTCTGATFNSDTKNCLLKSGVAVPIIGLTNDYAIIPMRQQLLLQLSELNRQLTAKNSAILALITNQGAALFSTQTTNRGIKKATLTANYTSLQTERDNIQQLIKEYGDLEKTQTESSLHIDQNHYWLILFFVIAIIVIYFLVTMSFGSTSSTVAIPPIQPEGQLGSGTYYFVFGIILVSLVVYYWKIRGF